MRYPDFRECALIRWKYQTTIDGWVLQKLWKRNVPSSPRQLYFTGIYDEPYIFRLYIDPADDSVWVERTCAWKAPPAAAERLRNYIDLINSWG